MTLSLVLFDADGVLLDSLAPHLAICRDISDRFALSLDIPSATELKRRVQAGVAISPMPEFFRAMGFPEARIEEADEIYRRTFMERYTPAPFPGTHEMLSAVRGMHLRLGIVTSNVGANVVAALGPSMSLFEPGCVYSADISPDFSKPHAIEAALRHLSLRPDQAVYVGDQPADREAARSSGVRFLGAAYGWGISENDAGFPVARRTSEIPDAIAKLMREAPARPQSK
jgi:phosphoglycolate phosphatase-like HAD superfamily hydrolase